MEPQPGSHPWLVQIMPQLLEPTLQTCASVLLPGTHESWSLRAKGTVARKTILQKPGSLGLAHGAESSWYWSELCLFRCLNFTNMSLIDQTEIISGNLATRALRDGVLVFHVLQGYCAYRRLVECRWKPGSFLVSMIRSRSLFPGLAEESRIEVN